MVRLRTRNVEAKRKNSIEADKPTIKKRRYKKEEEEEEEEGGGDDEEGKKEEEEEEGVIKDVARQILKETWEFDDFKSRQEEAIVRLISGQNAAVIFPTGGGKSLVYQVPALSFDEYDERCGRSRGNGLTLVICPLIALMKVIFCFHYA